MNFPNLAQKIGWGGGVQKSVCVLFEVKSIVA